MSPALTGRFFTSSPTWEVPLLLLVILILAMVSLVSHLVMNSPAMQETRFDSWVRKIHWRREWLPTAVSWPGEFHGLYSTWGRKKLDRTEQLSLSLYLCSLFIFYIAVHTSLSHTPILLLLFFPLVPTNLLSVSGSLFLFCYIHLFFFFKILL